MEAARYFEMLTPLNQSIQYHVREDKKAHIYSCGNLKSHITKYLKIICIQNVAVYLRVRWRGAA
jgi:hypothetical protein